MNMLFHFQESSINMKIHGYKYKRAYIHTYISIPYICITHQANYAINPLLCGPTIALIYSYSHEYKRLSSQIEM